MAVGPYGALLEAVRGVRWPARRPVAGASSGAHLARTRGIASEFAEYRPYRQGDDPRRLDWKLLARSDRAFTRLAPDHSVLATLIAVDGSASMAWPPSDGGRGEFGKWAAAKRMAVACSAIAHAAGDPVGLAIAGGTTPSRLPSRTRRGIVAEIARTLDAAAPGGTGSLSGVFRSSSAARGRVLLITDCLGDVLELRRAARAHIAAGGDVFVAHIVSRAELEPPGTAILATDPEDATVARALTEASRGPYVAAFDGWRAELSRGWRDDGVAYTQVVDDEATDIAVRRVLSPTPLTGARA